MAIGHVIIFLEFLANLWLLGLAFTFQTVKETGGKELFFPRASGLFPETIWEVHPTLVVWGAPILTFQSTC